LKRSKDGKRRIPVNWRFEMHVKVPFPPAETDERFKYDWPTQTSPITWFSVSLTREMGPQRIIFNYYGFDVALSIVGSPISMPVGGVNDDDDNDHAPDSDVTLTAEVEFPFKERFFPPHSCMSLWIRSKEESLGKDDGPTGVLQFENEKSGIVPEPDGTRKFVRHSCSKKLKIVDNDGEKTSIGFFIYL